MSSGVCPICRKPLAATRVRQGIRMHPHCRRSLNRDQVEAALRQAVTVLERLPERTEDPAMDELTRQARTAAQQLVADLQRLRGYLSPARGDDPPPDPARGAHS